MILSVLLNLGTCTDVTKSKKRLHIPLGFLSDFVHDGRYYYYRDLKTRRSIAIYDYGLERKLLIKSSKAFKEHSKLFRQIKILWGFTIYESFILSNFI